MKPVSIRERMAAGRALRDSAPRAAHADWTQAEKRDPIAILEASNCGRLPELIPLRYGRMLRNPFTFLRGAAAVMAHDLASTPVTGLQVQACGDCHLSNFGLFATPERNLIFDVNDFDETLTAPWEWDLKRLTASFVVAARVNGISDRHCREIAAAAARSYREHLRDFSAMSPLDVWYSRVSAKDLINSIECDETRAERKRLTERAKNRLGKNLLPKITEEQDGKHQFVEQPPVFTRITDDVTRGLVAEGLESYRQSLSDDRRFVFDRYQLEDFALRVVGVGSVGTRCYVALFFCDDRNPLLLQIKEARASVLEPFAARSPYENQGQRVVIGQRLMQAASDMFLGWLRVSTGRDFYVRQLRDMKQSIPVEDTNPESMQHYAETCGWTLARAHAKSGDAAAMSGYLGRSARFDEAVAEFAMRYADQTQQDHARLVAAVREGRVQALVEET